MNDFSPDAILALFGLPSTAELNPVMLAASIIAAAIAVAVGWLVQRFSAPTIARAMASGRMPFEEDRAPQVARIAGLLTGTILIAVAQSFYPWPPYSNLLLGTLLAFAAYLTVYALMRSLQIGVWSALAVALVAFVATLSSSLDGLTFVSNKLDEVGFSLGHWRFSLLTVTRLIISAIILFALIRLANKLVKLGVRRNTHLDSTQKLLVQKLAAIGIVVIAFFVGIDMLGIDITAFAFFSGAFGLAIGFGLQKTFGNLIAGLILLVDRSIKPGDVIVIGDAVGKVNKIGVRAVSIITRDGKEHLIPNENLMTQEVENWSYSSRNVRVRVPIGVSYDCDLHLAQKLMLDAAGRSKRVLKSPPPNVWLAEFGDNSVNHEILCWIRDPEEGIGNVRSEVLNHLWDLFKEHDIEIPFPQRDVHIKSLPDDMVLTSKADKANDKASKAISETAAAAADAEAKPRRRTSNDTAARKKKLTK